MARTLDGQTYRRTRLPYGVWTDADGREVLYNRKYQPLWERYRGHVHRADPGERVPWTSQRWFYAERDLLQPVALVCRLETILGAFIAGRPLPKSCDEPERRRAQA